MVYISVVEFAEQVVKNNPDLNMEDLLGSLTAGLAAKNNGATCDVCGQPIWAAGSGITGTRLCFTCFTGEWDSSDNYEIC